MKKIGTVQEKGIEKVLKNIRSEVVFYTRGTRFGAVEVKLINDEVATV